MFSGLSRHFKLLALLCGVFTFSVFAGNNQAITPLAKIYDGENLIGEVLSYGETLGAGNHGIVRKATIRNTKGQIRNIALKVFDSKKTPNDISKITKRWARLKPLFEMDHEGVLNYGLAGLKLVPVTTKEAPTAGFDVIINAVADNDVLSAIPALKLEPKAPAFDERLSTLVKFKRQVLSGLFLLNSNGLTHGDIKPGNVLYTANPGFNWKSPDSSKIHFSLSDFDSVSPIGKVSNTRTDVYAPPEYVAKGRARITPSWDLYSHAVSVYYTTFGERPYEEYFMRIHEHDHLFFDPELERVLIYDNPQRYQGFLKYVDKRFRDLAEHVTSTPSRKT